MLDTERDVRSLLSEVATWASTGCEVRECKVIQVRKHLGKRMAFVGLHVRDGNGRDRPGWVVLKYDGRQRAESVFHILRQLRSAGLRPPGHLRVPEPLGTSRDGEVLVQEWVAGHAWADTLGNGNARHASARAAEWLVTLQSLPVQVGASAAHLPSVRRYARELIAAYPSATAAIRPLEERLLEGLASVPQSPVLSHGDLHPKNLLIDGEVVTAVDFDTFAAREPAFDVGYAVGELLIMAVLRLGEAAAGLDAAAAFWFGYLQAGGIAGPERVALHVGRTFLQSLHYELCVL
ncbi:MAG: aminoglycoside phosphotransferase family protein, partial [Actinomycetota bacterium]|nr:aminoglycoside phosphotransferase family protein [Actinomycetota bacterium]